VWRSHWKTQSIQVPLDRFCTMERGSVRIDGVKAASRGASWQDAVRAGPCAVLDASCGLACETAFGHQVSLISGVSTWKRLRRLCNCDVFARSWDSAFYSPGITTHITSPRAKSSLTKSTIATHPPLDKLRTMEPCNTSVRVASFAKAAAMSVDNKVQRFHIAFDKFWASQWPRGISRVEPLDTVSSNEDPTGSAVPKVHMLLDEF